MIKILIKILLKKKRYIVLEDIDVDDIPSFIWYAKSDNSHGERFIVKIGDIIWKTTSSNKLSLKYKLEEAKKYFRTFKEKYPNNINILSMNGDLNNNGKELYDSFFDIVKYHNYNNLCNTHLLNNTDVYLNEDTNGLSEYEVELLKNLNFNI